eukprot:scaffold1919_cov394-Prasinococcus_capsulatus_cf.AAC.9
MSQGRVRSSETARPEMVRMACAREASTHSWQELLVSRLTAFLAAGPSSLSSRDLVGRASSAL